MSWIKCDSKVKAKCSFKNKCCGDQEGIYLEGSECDKFAQKVLAAPPTNADHIRSMSDEELAQFIPNWSYTDACKCGEHYVDCNNECEKCVADWLQQPAKEDAE